MNNISIKNIATGILLVLVAGIYYGCSFEAQMPEVREYPEIAITDFTPKTGKPNTLVTITGSNFGDFDKAATISFGGVESSLIESIADDQIQVRVPQSAVTGEVMVKVWTHEKSFGEEEFTVLPSAEIDSISPEVGVIGEELTIYGKNFGTDKSDVQVFFSGVDAPAEAEVTAVTDTEITVNIPLAITGELTVHVGPQVLNTEVFTFPFVGLDSRFDSEAGGWAAQQGANQSVANGELKVEFVGGKQADLVYSGTQVVDVATFPILAIRMSRLGDFDLQIETDKGKFGTVNNHNYVSGAADVFYWDLGKASFVAGDGSEVTLDGVSVFNEFRFNITSRSSETGYSVDWIKSFESVDKLKTELSEGLFPVGKLYFEFDTPTTPAPDWTNEDYLNLEFVDHRNTPMWQQDGKFYATHQDNRMGFFRSWDETKLIVTGYPADAEGAPEHVGPVTYSPEYPIIAVKGEFWGITPYATWNNSADGMLDAGNIDGTYLDGYTDVIYFDGSASVEGMAGYGDNADANGNVTFDQWGIQYRGEPAAVVGTDYSIDWVISFKSKEELEAYAANH